MRVNVYNEELTEEVEVTHVEPAPGRRYIGLRFMLESAEKLHHTPSDDDRSAVTLWVGDHQTARRLLINALDAIDRDHEAASTDAEAPTNQEAFDELRTEVHEIGRVIGNTQVRISIGIEARDQTDDG